MPCNSVMKNIKKSHINTLPKVKFHCWVAFVFFVGIFIMQIKLEFPESVEKEIWKDIPGYEGYYQISNTGNIKSLDRFIVKKNGAKVFLQGKYVSVSVHKHGHHVVRLWKENNTKLYNLYRLLALVYISNPENKKEVNHIDGNRMNFDLKNLEWVTASENMKHAYVNGLSKCNFEKGFKHKRSKLNNEKLDEIFERRKSGKKLNEIANEFGLNFQYVSRLLKGLTYGKVFAK